MLKKTQFARVEVGRRSGGQLATMLVATKSNIIFFHFPIPPPSDVFFSHRRSARVKKIYLAKVDGMEDPKT